MNYWTPLQCRVSLVPEFRDRFAQAVARIAFDNAIKEGWLCGGRLACLLTLCLPLIQIELSARLRGGKIEFPTTLPVAA